MAHLVIYLFINGVLIGYNLLWQPGFHWFYFPLLGWGLGLVMQYVLEIFYLQKDMERKEALAEKRAREQVFAQKEAEKKTEKESVESEKEETEK